MKLTHRFATLFATFMVGLSIYGLWSWSTIEQLKVNGPAYQRIVQGKDLIADILPPPEYILESYLVMLQARSAPPADRKPFLNNLKTLKTDFDSRRAFWLKESLEDALKDPMNSANNSAQELYRIAFNQWTMPLTRMKAC